MTYPIKAPRKLIEVALPLDVINEAASREKSIRHGHPSTLHLWWARRPLAAARAVIFSQLVNDPSWKWELENPGVVPPSHLKASWAANRKRLFKIIEDVVKWENINNQEILEKARNEIRRSWREVCELNQDHPQAAELFNPKQLPAFHDPFAGGGAIPLEAQRLGLEAYASDLNPVAVLINKAMIEIPPKFAGRLPVSLGVQVGNQQKMPLNLAQKWPGATGLAEDVRYYGQWMRNEAQKRIGHLYPKIEITAAIAHDRPDLKPLLGQKLTVIAWLWARTVKSPNPAFSHVDVPLTSTFMLSTKVGKEAWVEPVINGHSYHFITRTAALTDIPVGSKRNTPKPPESARNGTKLARGANFRCILSDTPIEGDYIKAEGIAGRMGARLMAIVAEGERGRVYLAPSPEHEVIAKTAQPQWVPEAEIAPDRRSMFTPLYGMTHFKHLFTSRQLVTLTTFSDLVQEARSQVLQAVLAAGFTDDDESLEAGGIGASAYADAVAVYLSLAVSKLADAQSSLCRWKTTMDQSIATFGRQAIPMVWDYSEANAFGEMAGDFIVSLNNMMRVIDRLGTYLGGHVSQTDAQGQNISRDKIVSTDPPYYDNIGYADLSDFFYVWLRRSLRPMFPSLFATLAVPKAEELVATPYRHSSKLEAEAFFLLGMTRAMQQLSTQAHPAFPVTIYYAFKQSETESSGTASTGWETFLEAVIQAGFALTGTWPMRTELGNRMVSKDTNALASSIVLVCRQRPAALTISRRQFLRELNAVLPEALDEMTKGAGDDISPVAPVDLSQAIIGPGMAVFSKYAAVLEADGSPMSVRTALQLINRFLAEDDFDADTQFCLHWFDQYGWDEGAYGEADVLARAKATSVGGLAESGVVRSGGGKVQLLRPSEYPENWNPEKDTRLPIWEALHQLIRVLRHQGETGAGELLAAVKAKGEGVRQLAYRLYTLCERRGWAEDARAYNELITSWSGIESAASQVATQPRQGTLFNN